MPRKRTSVEKIREILRLSQELKFSVRQIAEATQISKTSVGEYIYEFKRSAISYQEVLDMNDKDLAEVFEKGNKTSNPQYEALSKEFPYFEKELARVGVTLQILWEEYKQKSPDGFSYSRFCHHYRMWESKLKAGMHIEHKAGDLTYIDFTGKKMQYVDPETGEIKPTETFITILGASQLIYVEAIESQKSEDWICASENSIRYYGGATRGLCPDNLKAAVTKASKYEPDINKTYDALAKHYNTVVLPTRPAKPKDKSLVENAVRIVYQRIFAKLRNQTFFSLKELNEAIWKELEEVNNAPFQRRDISRRELFNEIEKNELQPLPKERFELCYFQESKVEFHHHVYLKQDKHYYSVPYRYTGQQVKTIYTARNVEIYKDNERIALHKRDRTPHQYTTVKDHMPPEHQFINGWNTDRYIKWASKMGDSVQAFIEKMLDSREHPQQAFKSCMGVLNLSKGYKPEELEVVCERALEYNSISLKFIKNSLKNNVHKAQLDKQIESKLPVHQNIRGKENYK